MIRLGPTQLHGLARIATMMHAQYISVVLVDERDLNAWPSVLSSIPNNVNAVEAFREITITACSQYTKIEAPFEHKRGPKPLPYWRTLKGRKR